VIYIVGKIDKLGNKGIRARRTRSNKRVTERNRNMKLKTQTRPYIIQDILMKRVPKTVIDKHGNSSSLELKDSSLPTAIRLHHCWIPTTPVELYIASPGKYVFCLVKFWKCQKAVQFDS